MQHKDLTRTIIGSAMEVHNTLGAGFLESVYQNALAHELSLNGISAVCERKIKVFYEDIQVGFFVADMLIDDLVIIENKAVLALTQAHESQLVNYLCATNIEIGLLFNFGADKLEYKRKNRIYRPSQTQ